MDFIPPLSQYVPSGVPQCTVLGPPLFLPYIKDIVNQCDSQMRLFSDDAVIYRVIKSPSDHDVLQNHLNNLKSWADDWQMDFNVATCYVLPVTNRRKSSVRRYSVDSQELSSVINHDYLGVRCSHDLRWNSHCSKAASKASRMLGLILRTLKLYYSDVKELSYLSMARPIVEYAAPVWKPYTTKDVV